jgi:hypothetical protein
MKMAVWYWNQGIGDVVQVLFSVGPLFGNRIDCDGEQGQLGGEMRGDATAIFFHLHCRDMMTKRCCF